MARTADCLQRVCIYFKTSPLRKLLGHRPCSGRFHSKATSPCTLSKFSFGKGSSLAGVLLVLVSATLWLGGAPQFCTASIAELLLAIHTLQFWALTKYVNGSSCFKSCGTRLQFEIMFWHLTTTCRTDVQLTCCNQSLCHVAHVLHTVASQQLQLLLPSSCIPSNSLPMLTHHC